MNHFLNNISVSCMILMIFLMRKLFRNRIPHMAFLFFWMGIGVRLLVPLSLESPYSFFDWVHPIKEGIEKQLPQIVEWEMGREISTDYQGVGANRGWGQSALAIIWGIGAFGCSGFFILQYGRAKKEISRCTEYQDADKIREWIREQNLPLRIALKQNKEMGSPFVWGVLHPTIILPEGFKTGEEKEIKFALLHECGHIKYFHTLIKILSMAAVSLYWYNPCVWLFYIYLDRDMEIMSDRYALGRQHDDCRAEYARSLLCAASAKKIPVFYYHYKYNFLKERVEAIMHFKKVSVGAAVMSVVLSASVMTVFGTTGVVLSEGNFDTMEIISIAEGEEEAISTLENQDITVDYEELLPFIEASKEKAASSLMVKNYKYECSGKIPPNEITITMKKYGYIYKGTLSRTKLAGNDSTGKYIGYYSGTLYRQ